MKKTCTNCDQEKEIEEFHKRKGGLYGRHAECKVCLRSRQAKSKEKWDEVKKKNRRDKENARRNVVKFVIDFAKKAGESSLNLQQEEKYKKYCSDFIKRKCRLFLNTAVQHGWTIKPDNCSECNKSGIIHGHHFDYSKPLEVIWLCPKCHGKYKRIT